MPRKKQEKFEKEKEIFLEHIQKTGLRRRLRSDNGYLPSDRGPSYERRPLLARPETGPDGRTHDRLPDAEAADRGRTVREVRFGDNKTYYEHHYNHQHHDHMTCTECGLVIEFFGGH